MLDRSRRRAMAAMVIAGSLTAASAVPSVAAAKKSKPLTKAQIVKLIKQYSKPGPQGRQGATGGPGPKGNTGPAGSYTIGSSSGLQLSGNALSVDSGVFGNCPDAQYMFGVSASGTGAKQCRFPVSMWVDREGYGGLGTFDITVSNTLFTSLASASAYGGDTYLYYYNANVQLESSGSTVVECRVEDTTASTLLRIAMQTVNDFANLEMQDAVAVPAGDTITVQCTNTGSGSVSAAATISALPLTGV
jgi:hypothetical protein